MAFASRAELIAEVAELLNRNDILDRIPTWIALAEADIRVDMRAKSVTLDDTISIDDVYVQLPEDVRVVRSLYDEYGPILLVAPEEIARLRSRYPSGGLRANYAAILYTAPTESLFSPVLLPAPMPNEAVTATIVYEPELTALEDDDDTNWLLASHPSVYLYGVAVHSAPYLRDDERIAVWQTLYGEHLNKLARMRDELEYGAGPLVAMPRRAIGG